jgi:hypothetical protein
VSTPELDSGTLTLSVICGENEYVSVCVLAMMVPLASRDSAYNW